MKVVAIADTHCKHRQLKLPKGDALVHAGDVSYRGKKEEVVDFLTWFSQQPFTHKIFIAGNHDFYFEKEKAKEIADIIPEGITYLNDSCVTINGLTVWGSPITPKFFNWAFNRSRGEAVRKHWALIPAQVDLLITHGPPFGIQDQVMSGEHVGCKDLLFKVREVRPKAHVFGHIHESHGISRIGGTRFINASVLNEAYEMVNRPVVFDI